MNIDHYRKSPNFSYSSLSALSISPSLYLNRKEDVISDAFRLGSALDCLLTENDKFYLLQKDKAIFNSALSGPCFGNRVNSDLCIIGRNPLYV